MELPASLYVPIDGGYESTALTIGPWDPGLQHAGPPAGLLLREAESASGIDGGQTVRLAYDIFAPVPVGPIQGSASVVRPGRRSELVESVRTPRGGAPRGRGRSPPPRGGPGPSCGCPPGACAPARAGWPRPNRDRTPPPR